MAMLVWFFIDFSDLLEIVVGLPQLLVEVIFLVDPLGQEVVDRIAICLSAVQLFIYIFVIRTSCFRSCAMIKSV